MKQPTGTEKPDTPFAPYPTKGVEGYPTFLPAQPQAIGSLLPSDKFPQNAKPAKLFEPLTIRGVTFPNRVWVSPMCMYSSDNGHATDHHFVHLGSMAMRGWGSIMVEATAIVPEGRISEHDAGLWQDSQIEPSKRIVKYVQALGGKIGIQLAHAGRKASTLPPFTEAMARDEGWQGGSVTPAEHGGWADNVIGASEGSFHEGFYPEPVAATAEYLENFKTEWLKAIERCKEIGYDFIEIHGAHGYFMHEFLSPISNKRTDKYGGSLENRLRFITEITEITRKAWDKPLFVRLSASDWLEEELGPEKNPNGDWAWWGIEQTTILASKLKELGVDMLDVSSGGNDLRGKIKVGPSYQVQFAEHIKKAVPDFLIGAVGIITEPEQANDILENGQADIAFFARQVLRDIDFPLRAAQELGVAVNPSLQYGAAWSRMLVPRKTDEVHHSEAAEHGTQRGEGEVEGEESKKTKGGRGSKCPPPVYASVP